MFDKDSRYANLPLKTHRLPDGQEVSYLARRIIPPAQPVMETPVQPGDRLDLIAHRAFGDPRQSWRVMDANPDPDPLTLADTPRAVPGAQPGDAPETAVPRTLKLSQIGSEG